MQTFHHDRRDARRLGTKVPNWLVTGTVDRPAALPRQPDITIEVLLDGDWHKRRPNNDAEIIDRALSVHEMTGKPTLLATCDTRQLYRAGAVGLPTILMPRADAT